MKCTFEQGSSRFSSLEDLTPNLDASDSDTSRDNHGSDLISKLPSTQTNAESNYDELLELCSGKFTGTFFFLVPWHPY